MYAIRSYYDAWADLVICRAGALTVAEVAAAGVPAIFVPLPHAVDDHQTRNAMSLTEAMAVPRVRGVHELRTRQSGPMVFLQLHLELSYNFV